MDIVASPTSTSAEEGVRFPISGASYQPRDRFESHENPRHELPRASTPNKPPVTKHLYFLSPLRLRASSC